MREKEGGGSVSECDSHRDGRVLSCLGGGHQFIDSVNGQVGHFCKTVKQI